MQSITKLPNQANIEQSEMSSSQFDNAMPQNDNANNGPSNATTPQKGNLGNPASPPFPLSNDVTSLARAGDAALTCHLYKLPNELLHEILRLAEYTPELHRSLLTTCRRTKQLASDSSFCKKIAETRFPEVCGILDMSSSTSTPIRLIACYHYSEPIEKAANIICEYLFAYPGGVRGDIIRQALYIIDANRIKDKEQLRQFDAWVAQAPCRAACRVCSSSVYARGQKRVWSGSDTKYTAKVLQYFLRTLLSYFTHDLCDIFDIDVWVGGDRKCEMVYAALERTCLCYDRYGSLAANIVEASRCGWWYGDGVRIPIMRWDLRAALEDAFDCLQRIFDDCSSLPTVWTDRETLDLWPLSNYQLLTDRIAGDGEGSASFYHGDEHVLETWSTADFVRFFDSILARQRQSVRDVCDEFTEGPNAQPIDWRYVVRAMAL